MVRLTQSFIQVLFYSFLYLLHVAIPLDGLAAEIPGQQTRLLQQNGPQRWLPQSQWLQPYGWVHGGYTYNGSSPTSSFNGPYNAIDRDVLQLNQLYGVLEKPLRLQGTKWDVGGRVDLMFGYDYFLTQSNGFERRDSGQPRWNTGQYGLAIPQAYGEIGNETVSLKLGHFYTIVGYEGVPAPVNFFYSKSYAYQFAGPFTHWGGLAAWNILPQLNLSLGIVNGWDALDRVTDRPALLAKIAYGLPQDTWNASFALVTGDEPSALATQFENRTRYSAILTLRLFPRLEYTLHHHLAIQEDGRTGGGTARWYGIDQYLSYRVNKTIQPGLRVEWFRDENGTRVGGSPLRGNGNLSPFQGSFFSVTGGVSITPHPNVTIRPEVRYDWFIGTRQPFNDGQNVNQFLAALNTQIQF